MSKKYGKGNKTTIKCQSCSYEKEIYSSGVHSTEGGSLKVYDTADEFFCPNCNVEDDTVLESNVQKPDDPALKQKFDTIISKNTSDVEAEKQDEENAKVKENTKDEKKVGELKEPSIKKRRRNIEKSLEVVFNQFKETSKDDFERYRKLEELRIEKEHEFQREQAKLEAERRKQEQEHELKMLAIMMGNVTQTHNPSLNVSSVFCPQANSPVQQNNCGVPYMQPPFQPPFQPPNDVIFEKEADEHTYFKL